MVQPRRFIYRFLGFLPRQLPIGAESFQSFVSDLFSAYGVPNTDGYQDLIANVILHSGETQSHVRPRRLYKIIRKAQANEVAWNVKETIRAKKTLAQVPIAESATSGSAHVEVSQ